MQHIWMPSQNVVSVLIPCARCAGETERNLIPTNADAEEIEEYLAEPLEVCFGYTVWIHSLRVAANAFAYNSCGLVAKCSGAPVPHARPALIWC